MVWFGTRLRHARKGADGEEDCKLFLFYFYYFGLLMKGTKIKCFLVVCRIR